MAAKPAAGTPYRRAYESGARGIDGDEPWARLAGLGQAYRACAFANRSYYAVMFARRIPRVRPVARGVRGEPAAVAAAHRRGRRVRGGGYVPARRFAHAARVLWAASHGAVSLELAGYEGLIDPAACYEDLVAAAAASFFASGAPATRRGGARTVQGQEARA